MRVCMLVYNYFESDARVRHYAESLVKRGEQVDVIALKEPGQENHSIFHGCNLYRIQERVPDEKNKF
jgi:hypothetical protein